MNKNKILRFIKIRLNNIKIRLNNIKKIIIIKEKIFKNIKIKFKRIIINMAERLIIQKIRKGLLVII